MTRQRMANMAEGTIIKTVKHATRDELVFLGVEEHLLGVGPIDRAYFTRRGKERGQFWGNYCMELKEAESDLEERRTS